MEAAGAEVAAAAKTPVLVLDAVAENSPTAAGANALLLAADVVTELNKTRFN